MAKRTIRLLWVFPSFQIGGAQSRFAALVGALGDGYEHAVAAMDGNYDAERLIPTGVAWRRVEITAKSGDGVSLGAMWRYRRMLARERPDVLLTSNWGAIEWLLVNRGPGAAPHIHFEDGLGADETADAPNASRAWARRRAFPGKGRRFVTTSGAMRDVLSRHWGAKPSQIELIPNGVDIDRFARIEREGGRSPVRIGAIGALRPEKRFDRLIDLIATLRERGRDVSGMLVGDGPERAALETHAASKGVAEAVHFVGAQADTPAFLEQMDIYSVTSEAEQAPIGLVEAMASGLPVVATAVGDVPEMLSTANALFVRPSDDDSGLAAAAELLATDPRARLEVGAANKERAGERFSLTSMAERYDALLREMARGGNMLMLPAPEATTG